MWGDYTWVLHTTPHHTTPHHTTAPSHYRTLQQYYSGKKFTLVATHIVQTLHCKMFQCVSCLAADRATHSICSECKNSKNATGARELGMRGISGILNMWSSVVPHIIIKLLQSPGLHSIFTSYNSPPPSPSPSSPQIGFKLVYLYKYPVIWL